MTQRFPDIEIYLMKASADDVLRWLKQHISPLKEHSTEQGRHWVANNMDIFFHEQAEKNFSSLWFKQNQTPWNNDLECARSAHHALGCEVRCTDSSWQEDAEHSQGGWIKIIRGQEKAFTWI